MNSTSMFKNFIDRVPKLSWRHLLEKVDRCLGLFCKVQILVVGHLTKEYCLASLFFIRRVRRLHKQSGPLFMVLYLKQVGVLTMRFLSESTSPIDPSAPFVATTGRGIPLIIPPFYRKLLSKRDERSMVIGRFILSWCSLSRLIPLAKKVSKSTFKSMNDPCDNIDLALEVSNKLKLLVKPLSKLYLPRLKEQVLQLGMSWVPSFKAIPNSRDLILLEQGRVKQSNFFTCVKYEIAAFAWLVNHVHAIQDGFYSPGVLFKKGFLLYPFDMDYTRKYVHLSLDWYEATVGPQIASTLEAFPGGRGLEMGRLAQTLEGAGKRRIFAIGNYIKQRLLHPVHQWAMDLLRSIPMDGTYNQGYPIERLLRQKFSSCFSFDLKSATDRWPLVMIYSMLVPLWGTALSSSIVNSTLGLNVFSVLPPMVKKRSQVTFTCGQPLGYYASWALFSLSHHFLVWLAAYEEGSFRTRPFTRYALLGDDIVIAHKGVAERYKELVTKLGVAISLSKSVICETGSFEFAKRFYCKDKHGVYHNVSPISMVDIATVTSITGVLQIGRRYNVTNPNILFRLKGAGYRVLSRLHSTRSRKWERLWVAATKPLGTSHYPLEWWIGRGNPINPYLKGQIVAMLRKEFQPKDIRLVPSDLFSGDGEEWMAEYTTYRSWITSWLKWTKWWVSVCADPNPSIRELFNAPIMQTYFKVKNQDTDRIKFGLIWRCYDMGAGQWSKGRCPNWVLDTNTKITHDRWVHGGITGNDFLMSPVEPPIPREKDDQHT